MTPRELAGAINRATAVYVFVDFADHPGGSDYFQIGKTAAKAIVETARENNVESITAEEEEGELFIGPEYYDGDEEMPDDEDSDEGEDEEEEEEIEPPPPTVAYPRKPSSV